MIHLALTMKVLFFSPAVLQAQIAHVRCAGEGGRFHVSQMRTDGARMHVPSERAINVYCDR